MTGLAYRSHGGGLGSFLAHSAIWHVIGRLLWSVPLPVAVVVGGLACGWVFLSRRGSSARFRPSRRVRR